AHGVVTWSLSTVPAGTVPDPATGPMVDVTTAPFIDGACIAPASSEGRDCTVHADCDSDPMVGDGRCFYSGYTFTCEDTLTNVAAVFGTTPDPDLTNNVAFTTTEFDKASRAGLGENCATPTDDNCDGLRNCDDPICECGLFAPALSDEPGGGEGDGGGDDGDGECVNLHGESFQPCCCDSTPCNFGGEGGSPCNANDPNFKESDPPTNAFGFGNVDAGQTITYTIHYENIGGVDATDVLIVDPLDGDLDETTLVINDGGVYDPATRLIRWNDPVLPPATPRAVSYSVAVRADAPSNTRVRNRATIIFPTALDPRTDSNFLEHVVVDPSVPKAADLAVIDCAETSPGSGEWRVMLQNAGLGFAYDVTAMIVNPPSPVQVSDGTVRFAHPDDADPDILATVMPQTRPTSMDTVAFTTQTPESPCDALVWHICHRPSFESGAPTLCEDVQHRPDRDQDAVADEKDNCPDVFNPGQADGDGDGMGDACTVLNAPPDCGAAVPSRAILWPPNHRLVNLGISGVSDPDGDATTVEIVAVTQDEPVLGDGSGTTCPDAAIDGGEVKLRAERSGRHDGRIYRVSFEARDPQGAQCSGEVRVCVPHDRSGRGCIERPEQFDSLDCAGPHAAGP
ncbi:MAG: hypothetical protein PVF51_11160, partial [Nitrospirota bacterium]